MIDWKLGGRTGSLRKRVRYEVRNHIRSNPVARNERYHIGLKTLRKFLGERSFGSFITIYIFIDLAVGLGEAILSVFCNVLPQPWTPTLQFQRAAATIQDVSGSLLTVQIGMLGVVSLALALVTLIAQNDNSSMDVRVYYHEALAFELVASGIALLVVMCVQLFWPVQAILQQLGLEVGSPVFKASLLGVHFFWLIFNLCGTAHFIATTLGFVQQSEREKIRRRYTVNFVLPRDLTNRLRDHFYTHEMPSLLLPGSTCSVFFGIPNPSQGEVELNKRVLHPISLYDVRVIWVKWVLLRWEKRCSENPNTSTGFIGPTVWFTPVMGRTISENIDWCQRSGGVPFNKIELFVLKHSFRFKRVSKHA